MAVGDFKYYDATLRDPQRGLLLMVVGIALFSILNGVVKSLAELFPVNQIIFFRNAFALPALWLLMAGQGGFAHLRTGRPLRQFGLALLFSATLLCIFEAYARMPLADVTAISFSQPLIVIVLAALIGPEKPVRAEWIAVAIGLLGIAQMVQPTGQGSLLGAALALGGAVFGALNMLLQRSMSATDSSLSIAFYTLAGSALLMVPTLGFAWVAPTPLQWLGLIAMGIVSGFCQYLTVRAFYHASASAIAPVTYSKMLWALVIGFFWFGEWPALPVLIGTTIVLVASLIAFRSAAHDRKVQAMPESATERL